VAEVSQVANGEVIDIETKDDVLAALFSALAIKTPAISYSPGPSST